MTFDDINAKLATASEALYGESLRAVDPRSLSLLTRNARPKGMPRREGKKKGTHRQSRWFFICACKAFLPAAP